MDVFFDNSYQDLVSFLVHEKNIGTTELAKLTQLVHELKNKKP
jgi:hypothetical protein